jgi:fructose-bisphosphate aldolase class II
MNKTLREYINEAKEKGVAVGHFNISNLEALHGIFNAARKLELPIIIGLSEGERKFVGVHEAAALVKSLKEQYNYPIFLNADHTYTFEGVKEAIDAGFDSVIFDGVNLPFEENIIETKKCVDYARAQDRDVLVEAELGNIGQSSKVIDEVPEGVATDELFMTSVEDAVKFVKETGVDMLAPAVGNMHGMLKGKNNPRIDEVRVKEISDATGIPLVLHGGSGLVDEDFTKGIKNGMACVHINTEIRIAYVDSVKKAIQEYGDQIAPYKLMKDSVSAVEAVVEARLKLFNHI